MKELKIHKFEYSPELPTDGFSYIIERQHTEIETKVNGLMSKGWKIHKIALRKDVIIFFMVRDIKLRNMENGNY